MTTLLIHTPEYPAGPSAQTVFGGLPSAPHGRLSWPSCEICGGNMQFLGQIHAEEDELLLLFMCQNDPGCCEEWDANEGGNKVLVVGTQDLQLVPAPKQGETVRPVRYGSVQVECAEEDYDEARDAWADASGTSGREILGQLGGEPGWIQADDTPDCDECGEPMQFVAQLEEGPDMETAMNFGSGGSAYVFRCSCSRHSAKFLWQCD